MDHDNFIGEVQNRAELSSRGEALSATRATFTTLSERLQPDQAENLAAQLPETLAHHLEKVDEVERFEYQEFMERVAERSDHLRNDDDGRPAAAFQAQVVMDLVGDIVSEGQMNDLRADLPEEYGDLFELQEADEVPVEDDEQL